jgi:hypothetical protein
MAPTSAPQRRRLRVVGDPHAAGRLHTQYFEIMGSRAIYHDA